MAMVRKNGSGEMDRQAREARGGLWLDMWLDSICGELHAIVVVKTPGL